jgi:hypothetical protein
MHGKEGLPLLEQNGMAATPIASGLGFNDQLAQNLTKLAEQRAIEQFSKER